MIKVDFKRILANVEKLKEPSAELLPMVNPIIYTQPLEQKKEVEELK